MGKTKSNALMSVSNVDEVWPFASLQPSMYTARKVTTDSFDAFNTLESNDFC
jgi:hypothetical protein